MTTRRNQIQSRIETAQAEIERLRAEAERIDAMPDFSIAPVGSVVAIATTFRNSPKPFVYIAYLASPGRWYITGEAGYRTAEELAEFLTSRTRQVVAVHPLAEIRTDMPTEAIDLGTVLGAFLANAGQRD